MPLQESDKKNNPLGNLSAHLLPETHYRNFNLHFQIIDRKELNENCFPTETEGGFLGRPL